MKTYSVAQKELLKWHWKLGIGMYCIQEMMHEQHYEDPDGKTSNSAHKTSCKIPTHLQHQHPLSRHQQANASH